jgi:hypothetical protein
MGEHAALLHCLTHRSRTLAAYQMVSDSGPSRNDPILIQGYRTRIIEGKFAHYMTTIDTGCDKDFGADGEWLLFGTWADLNAVDHAESMSQS